MATRQASKSVNDWQDVDLTKDQGKTGVGALDAIGDIATGLNPLPAIGQAIAHPIDTAKGLVQAQGDQFSKARQDVGKGNYADAISHGASGLIPIAGPFLSNAWDRTQQALEGGDTHGAIQTTASALQPALVPPLVRGAGKAIAAGAPALAEQALGIRGQTHHYGATPGKAILEETSGVRPATIQTSAQGRLGDLNTQLEALAQQSPDKASLTPARAILDSRRRAAAAGNSASTPNEMGGMLDQLTNPRPGFRGQLDPQTGGIAPLQAPDDFLRMKREFGKDFTRWNPLNPSGETGTARQAYGAMADEFNRAVPGAAPLNQKISSLIPVAERANLVQHNATLPQRAMGRVAAHTGALAGAGLGYATHGLPGAVAGLVVPEFLSDPTVQMIGARSMNAAGKGLQQPLVRTGAAGAAMAPKKKPDEWQDVTP